MDHSFWVKMHGGATHFPIALVVASTLFDLVGSLWPDNQEKTRQAGFRAAGHYTLILAALASFGAVVSGLVISGWQLWGRGNLARHHTFLWPAFGLLIGLAVWRLAVGSHASGGAFKIYLALSIITTGLMGAAGYWGGELLLNG
jgi:uncharacterized membrane protein